MKTRLILKPGQKGTKKLTTEYGDRLVCVRYRYDEIRKRRYKTVELIVEEKDWSPPERVNPRPEYFVPPYTIVGVRVDLHETDLREKVKQAGGFWNYKKKLWEMEYQQAEQLGIESRVVEIISI